MAFSCFKTGLTDQFFQIVIVSNGIFHSPAFNSSPMRQPVLSHSGVNWGSRRLGGALGQRASCPLRVTVDT